MRARIGVFSAEAEALAGRFWPGPLTLVVPAREGTVCDLARAGLSTLPSACRRIPSPAVLEAADRPIAAPSANRSGRASPTSCRAYDG